MPPSKRRRILIVDDERIVSDTLVHIFESHGFEARSALSAEQALESVSDWTPEIAILDICLPGMNGVELAIKLLAQHPKCRLLLFSGRPESEDLLKQFGDEMTDTEIMPKPVHPSTLLAWAAQKPIE